MLEKLVATGKGGGVAEAALGWIATILGAALINVMPIWRSG